MPINLARSTSSSASASRPDEARALVAEQASRDRHGQDAGEPRGEGDLADRPAALRGVHPRLHRQAVADRPEGAAARRSSAGCRSATPSTTATSTTPTRACPVDGYTAWLERMADHPNIEVRLDTDFFDVARRRPSGKVPSSTPGRSTPTSTTPRASSPGAPSTSSARSCDVGDFQGTSVMNYADEDVPVHPDPRVPALPPRAGCTRRTRPSSCASTRASPSRATSRTTRSTPPRTARSCSRTASWPRRSPTCCSAAASAPTSTSTCTWRSARRCRCTTTSSGRTSPTGEKLGAGGIDA